MEEQPEFESPLKGLKWEEMTMPQRLQALLSQGKDAERFQQMAAKATQKDLHKAADDNMGGLEKRKPEEIQICGLTYNTNYLLNALKMKKDKRKEKEDDPMSVYDSSLMAGPSIKTKVHNQAKGKLKQAAEENDTPVEENNSGEAASLDFAVRNIDGMKRHMNATNIGKRLPGKKKKAFEEDKDEIKAAYFLAGLIKSAGDILPDFEESPESFVGFLAGFTKSASFEKEAIFQYLARLLKRTTQPESPTIMGQEAMPWTAPPEKKPMGTEQLPVQDVESAKKQHIGGGMPVTRAGQLAAAAKQSA